MEKKQGSITYLLYGPQQWGFYNKMFITWLPVWGTGNKCKTSNLTVIWRSKIKMQTCHDENVYSVKAKSTVSIRSPKWHWSLLKGGHCVWLKVMASIFFFVKTPQMAKKLLKIIKCRYFCYHTWQRNRLFSHRQNVSNLCKSIFIFLTAYCL